VTITTALNRVRHFLRYSSFYPVTGCYLLAVMVLVMVSSGWFGLELGIVILGFMAVLVTLGTMEHQMSMIHRLVRDDMERICQLTEALTAAGVEVPPVRVRHHRSKESTNGS
jgi:hypothetical protein